MTNTATATWVHEFPEADYDISPVILNAEGIRDLSWHNNVCPSFGLWLDVEGSRDTLELSIWCEVDDPEQREAGEGKYTVTCMPWEDFVCEALHDAGIPCSPYGENVHTTDDPREALNTLAQLLTDVRRILAAAGHPATVRPL